MSDIRATVTIDRPLSPCCDVTATRYALSAIRVLPRDDESVFCFATDGKILAIAAQRGNASAPCLLPSSLAKVSSKTSSRALLNGTWNAETGRMIGDKFRADGSPARSASEPEGRFPNASYILPIVEENNRVVSIDAHLLKKLADAIGDNGRINLILSDDPAKPIAVDGEHGIGVIMPLSTDDPKDDAKNHAIYRKRFSDYAQSVRKAEKKIK